MFDNSYNDYNNNDDMGDDQSMYAPQQPQSQGGFFSNLSPIQMTGMLMAAGMPIDKAMTQMASLQERKQAQAMQNYKMQMAQNKYMQQQQGNNDLINEINGGGAQVNPGMPMADPTTEDGAATLGEMNGQPNMPTDPSMGQPPSAPNPNTMGNTGMGRYANVDDQTKRIATSLIKRGNTAAGLKMLNDAINPDFNPLQKELAKKDAETISTAETDIKDLMGLKGAINSFKTNIKGVPDALMGRGTGFAAPYLSSNAQAAEADANTIALIGKKLLSMPSNNFSDADRDFLVNATVGLNKSKDANAKTIARLEDLIGKQVDYTQSLTDRLSKNGNLRGVAIESYNKNYGEDSANHNAMQSNPQSSQAPKYSKDQLQAWAKEAIAAGKDPTAVNQKLSELLGNNHG